MRSLVLAVISLFACERPRALPPVAANHEVALLAGGCFWGMEGILREVPGVVDTEVGYVAGAEAIRVVFDPARLTYEALLDRYFFRMHDPTTLHRQGNDIGAQYRSAIFFTSAAQHATAVVAKERAAAFWNKPITTEIAAASSFTPAADHHQDYLKKHPNGYTCHYLRDDPML